MKRRIPLTEMDEDQTLWVLRLLRMIRTLATDPRATTAVRLSAAIEGIDTAINALERKRAAL